MWSFQALLLNQVETIALAEISFIAFFHLTSLTLSFGVTELKKQCMPQCLLFRWEEKLMYHVLLQENLLLFTSRVSIYHAYSEQEVFATLPIMLSVGTWEMFSSEWRESYGCFLCKCILASLHSLGGKLRTWGEGTSSGPLERANALLGCVDPAK